MEEQPLRGEHSQPPWPPGGFPPSALPSPHNRSQRTHGPWTHPLPEDIARIVQRFPATWSSEDRERLFEWVLDEKRATLERLVSEKLRFSYPGATREDVDEVVAEKITDAYRALDTFNPARGSFLNWLYTMLKRHSLRRGSQLARRRSREIPLDVENHDSPGMLKEWPDAAALTPARQAQILAVRQCLNRLPEPYRDALQRFYGLLPYTTAMSIQEIATAQHIKEGYVRVRLHKARQLLKALLEEEEPPTSTPGENA
jgi:RNA polymerase sigma-70 factor, ECF subfamily